MGIFKKAPLDEDFEKALRGDAVRYQRAQISRAQGLIRAHLQEGERLDLIFSSDYTFKWILVFTARQRVLIFRMTDKFFGSNEVEDLEYACVPEDLLLVRWGKLPQGGYGVTLRTRQNPDAYLIRASQIDDAKILANVLTLYQDFGPNAGA